MNISEATIDFVCKHANDDVRKLALSAKRAEKLDLSFALDQIAGRQKARTKLPSWYALAALGEGVDEAHFLVFPPHISMEQCSSEATASYKYGIVAKLGNHASFADLTGGFGIDCWFMSQAFQHTTYIERQKELASIALHNFHVLSANNRQLDVVNNQSADWLQQQQLPLDWLYIDPARRDDHGGKTVAISDCEPDVSKLEELLVSKASYVMIKLSPMLDLDLALKQLKHVVEVHIVAVDNECKELLLILNKEVATNIERTPIHCVNIKKDETQQFVFSKIEEQQTTYDFADQMGKYLYEPNAAIMKAGAFRSLAKHYSLHKLHPNSHLYTSDSAIPQFPGRMFQVETVIGFGKKELKSLLAGITKVNLTVRNFPASVAELRKRLHLTEGGDIYLFATTLYPEQKILIKCKR